MQKYEEIKPESTCICQATNDPINNGSHWYVQFRSIETYEGQPHERGVFVEADPGTSRRINGFWANVRYVVRARSYAKMNNGSYYSIGSNLIEVDRFTTPRCPSGSQARDGLRGGEPNAENRYRCEMIPQPPAPPVPDDPLAPGRITEDAANAWGATNNLRDFAVILRSTSQDTVFANIFIFYGGDECPATYIFRSAVYGQSAGKPMNRNGCAHQSIL